MVQAYNFLASWQLIPEKSIVEYGDRSKSGYLKLETSADHKEIVVSQSWVAFDNTAYYSEYSIIADGEWHPLTSQDLADSGKAWFSGSHQFDIEFHKNNQLYLAVTKQILPNGQLQVKQAGHKENGEPFTNLDYYHKQLSVLPYASSIGSVAIAKTEEGAIKHKALLAMEEQTEMQLTQIKEQIELLANQAGALRKRKELSLMIYEARMNFQPIIGQVYFLYEKRDGHHILSLVSPREWGLNMPYRRFVSCIKLLADHTWQEIDSP